MGISREGSEPGIRTGINRGPASSRSHFFPPALKYHTFEVISPWNSQQLNRFINTVLSGQRETEHQGGYHCDFRPQ